MAFGKREWLFLLVLVLSATGGIMLLASSFGGLYYNDGYIQGERYACLGCDYNASFTIAAILGGGIPLLACAVIAVNELLPARFIKPDLTMLAIILAFVATGLVIAGGIDFGVIYDSYSYASDWWLDAGFYGGVIAGPGVAVLAIALFTGTSRAR